MRSFAAAAVTGMLALTIFPSLVSAQTCTKQFQLVGFSTTATKGNGGIFRMTDWCQLDFEASRVCTSEEVMNTVNIPPLTGNNAWVRPAIKPVGAGVVPLMADASGSDSADGSSTSLPADLTCRGWTEGSDYKGLTVNTLGGFRTLSCDTNRQIACCALIPIPEPSLGAMQGGAVAALASLSGLQKMRARKPSADLVCEEKRASQPETLDGPDECEVPDESRIARS